MPAKRHPVIDESIVHSLSEVLGRTEGGLTNKQINELLAAARIPDPTPPAPRGTHVMISKRDRLFNALAARQRRDRCGNAVLAFVAKALAPFASTSRPERSRRCGRRSTVGRDENVMFDAREAAGPRSVARGGTHVQQPPDPCAVLADDLPRAPRNLGDVRACEQPDAVSCSGRPRRR